MPHIQTTKIYKNNHIVTFTKNFKCLIDSIAYNLIGPFCPSSKWNTYVLMCICLLINYPIAIHIPNKTAVTVIKAYLQHICSTFGGSLTLIQECGKEFKNEQTILYDHKSLGKFLKGQMENYKVNNWWIELSSYNLSIDYIKGPKTYWLTAYPDL